MQKAAPKPPLLKTAQTGQRKAGAPIVKNRVKFSYSKDGPVVVRESSSVPRQQNRCHGSNRDLGVRTSSANGPQQIGRKIRLLPDQATSQMANLKQVKFLDPESDKPVRPDDAQLSAQYKMKKETLDKSLQKVIDKTKVAHMQILKKSKEEIERKRKAEEEAAANMNPLARLMQSSKKKDDEPSEEEEKFADGFVRSKRNVELRVKQQLLTQINIVEEEKTNLIQKMNKMLIKLDRQNQAKREIGEKLLEQVKFVRELQIATSKGDDIGGVISDQLKSDFQRERELNQRLQEELKKCEKERLRLLDRIKLLSGEKEIEVEETDGVRRTFKVTQVNIQRILDELRSAKDTMSKREAVVNQSRGVVQGAENEVADKQHLIDQLRLETDRLTQDIKQLENKYRDTIYLNEGARDRMGGLHKMHVKLLATRQLEEIIDKALTRSKKDSVNQMLFVTRGYVNQFGAIYRLRNLLLHQSKRISKNALARWFKLACDPMMLVEQNRKIPEFFAKFHKERLMFNREFEQWMLSQGLKKHQDSQLDVMKGCINNFWHRELRLRFQMWKDNVKARKSGLKVLDKALSKMVYFEKARAFTKWTTFVAQQDYHTRMHGMAVFTALNRQRISVFYGWRSWSSACKANKLSLKKRVLRQLRVAVQRKKYLQKMALSALGFQIQADKNVVKQCFDALRQNKEDEKLVYVRDKLDNETEPECQQLLSQINHINAKGEAEAKQRATTAFVTLFGRQLSQAFHRWKNCAQYKKVEQNGNFKIRLVKLYRSKLSKAFNLWRVNRASLVIEMETMQMEDIQSSNAEIEETCRKREVEIKAADRSSKNMGAKHLKKLVSGAFLKHTQQYFNRWRKKNEFKTTQVSASELILKKVRTRYLRMAWNRYRYGMILTEQDIKNENRLEDVRIRLNYRQKKRIFNAIRGFNHRNVTARGYLKTLVSGLERDNKDTAFRRWKDFNNKETSIQWAEEVQSLKNTSEELKREDGVQADKLYRAKDKQVRASNGLEKGCQKTLRKWAMRLLHNQMGKAFKHWKSNSVNLVGRERTLVKMKKQLLRNSLRQAVARWKICISLDNIELMKEEISAEDTNLGIQQSKVQQQLNNTRREMDRSVRKKKIIDEDLEKQMRMYENIVVTLSNKNANNHFTSRRSQLFMGWKDYTQKRKRCCEILSTALRKSALQRTFTMINEFQRDIHLTERKEKTAEKCIRSYQKFRMKAAISKWREHEYHNMVVLIEETNQELNTMKEDFSVHRENIKEHHTAVRSAKKKQRTLADYFSALQVYASEERDIRMRTKNLQEIIKSKKGSKALKKWQMRVQKTHQMQAFMKRAHFIKKAITLKATFQAWSGRKIMDKSMGYRVTILMEGIRNVNTQSAFDMIKRYAAEKYRRDDKHKGIAMGKFERCLANQAEFRLRYVFNKWRQFRDRCVTRQSKMRQAFNNMDNAYIRSAFINWKNKAHQSAIHFQNEEEDGPTNLEAWKLRQDNFNLIKLLKEDGLTTKDITRIHQQAEDTYQRGVEKVLCRIVCKQTDDLYLLPACLDRWKKYTRIRKLWRRTLKDADIRTLNHDDMAAKLWAFRRLKYTHEDRQQVLYGRPIARLRRQCVENVEKLDRLADAVENKDGSIGNLTGQRNNLLKSQISGQKLAFSLSISNQERTKMEAMSKFQDYGTKRLQSKIELAIGANLDRIGDLKTTIAQFERENDQLAQQNDEFRRGAMDGITMVRHVEALTSDRDKLSVDLADKAFTIRKLLEDNQYLQNKLTSAKTHTDSIIDKATNQAIKRNQSRESLTPVRDQRSNSPLRIKHSENDQRMINNGTKFF